ncbi:MAG: DUF3857 domain-containing protein [Ferruginibacter sp.]
MKKILILSVIVFLFLQSIQAANGDGEYAVSKIAPALLKHANAVLRLEEVRFEIKSTTNTKTVQHYVITVLNEKGEDWAEYVEHYSKSREITFIEGILYDANGKQLKKIKKKDVEDVSGVEEGTLMADSRMKKHSFYYRPYPYTIEYTTEIEDNNTLFFPTWIPQGGEGLSVEKSSAVIISPADYKVRYKAFNYKDEPVITQEKNDKVMTWQATNIPAIQHEPFSPQWQELTTMVIFGPSDFQMDDYKGNMVNWQEFGKFVYSLKKGRDELPDDVKKAIHAVADNISDPKEKIAKLYEYMQKNTRYISIQLGIGGWQPFEAKDVASKGYGDCKALSNYMYSILKEVGVLSYYTLIRAGNNQSNNIITDFPSQQFNHVILCVPSQPDSIWLECTSQTLQAGYLSGFTADRPALLIDENGGKLIRTPKYGMKTNILTRNVNAVLDEEGTLAVKSDSRYCGLLQDNIHGVINGMSKDKVKQYLHYMFDFATYDVNQFSYKQEKNALPTIDESLDISVSNYATITGKRLFIMPNVMGRNSRKLTPDSTRKYDVKIDVEYQDLDSVVIELPKGYTAEAIPDPVSLNSKFGKYSSSVKLVDNKLYYYRNLESFSGRFPPASYDELVKYYAAVYKADNNKVVLVKN